MAQFETQTNYFFIPSAAFAAVATAEEISLARVFPVVNQVDINKVYRKKADAKRFTDAGFAIEYVTKTQVVVNDRRIGDIQSKTIGPIVFVDRVEDKYDDSMGAYQVAYGRDAEGNEMSQSNMYDTNAVYAVGPVEN